MFLDFSIVSGQNEGKDIRNIFFNQDIEVLSSKAAYIFFTDINLDPNVLLSKINMLAPFIFGLERVAMVHS